MKKEIADGYAQPLKNRRIAYNRMPIHRFTTSGNPVLHRLKNVIVTPLRPLRKSATSIMAMQQRERARLWHEMHQMRGLLPLLMKQRSGCQWTELDRKRLKVHLRKLVELSPYMILFVAPGGFFVLPLLVWWLDRRHPEVVAAPTIVTEQIQP
jgi:hypothetical protein